MSINVKKSTCNSADKVLENFIAELKFDTAHHRMEKQGIKCGFGLQGVCCKLCANGPCRITPNAPKGVCGATADTIVARNFLRAVASGSACYLHVVENTANNLKETGKNKGVIKGKDTLNHLCQLFEIEGKDEHEKALLLGEKVLSDLYKPRSEKMELVKKLAYEPRFKNWQELSLLPGGAKSEVFDAIVKTSTNLNSDPVNMLLHSLRLGISTGLYGLVLTNLLNDIMLGEPKIRSASVGFKVVNTDYINIMITGHQHSFIADLQDTLSNPSIVEKAKEVGAKGFKLVGSTCVGQDLQLRGEHYKEVFAGHSGNNFTSEALISTGAIDLIVSEFNCTFPGIEPITEELMVKMICIDDVAKKSNAEYINYSYEERKKITNHIINEAINSYSNRRSKVKFNLPENHGNDDTLTGVSETSLKNFLGGTFEPLLNLIAQGKIKGVAGVVGCSNLVSGGHDVFTVELTKELIKRDILVLSAGCSSGGLENVGLMSPSAAKFAGNNLREVCESLGIPPVLNFGPCLAIGRLEAVATELAKLLNVDLPKLPLVLSAPQWLEEQALADGAFGLALGLPLHLAKPPFITGSTIVTKVLTEILVGLTGGKLILDDDVLSTADKLEEIILSKRSALNI
ncbi:MAG: anaerobic carbon-monoxide dehydrogenase catalytic subunit [Clostridium argentinense]|uniref:Carbon monoxide dehydrogenase n=1 Tax=Clostridium faecium TaxID=2762223 RepID=A0ABR8YQJ3_9CLOT|nr:MULTISPECIES: anaerobic carbon-monoxide dehydrogenase catalytic subunit [Clostridium]MBD8046503.1 anaerobic carbon-monoxide dehydrogenase catalytic subunit [Clostridium faecium]MBS5823024.1 anaerobic carbon-monoxide dehydrogenase catalytic subunit [Clostridium argentinense]MDU1349182.1 anaerobic carbon-monoxide dehydrogenase catalytic subunit [Clostridium argentinense]